MLILSALNSSNPLVAIFSLILAVVLGITVHEFAHAAMATWLGDTLPRREGRVTLAPHAHLDPMGALMFVIAGFGWGRAVSINPYALRTGPRTGSALVAFAGPTANVIIAVMFATVVRGLVFILDMDSPEWLIQIINVAWQIGHYNLILSFLNLIPVYPLDGFTVLLGLLPYEWAERFEQTRQYGFFVLMLLMVGGASTYVLWTPVDRLWGLLTGIPF